jgi:hypothetical protein
MPQSFADLYSQSAHRFANHYQSYAQDYRLDLAALDDKLLNLIRALVIYNQLEAWPNMAQRTGVE